MANIIKFPDSSEFKHVTYIEYDGDLGVSTKPKSLSIIRLNNNEFEIATCGNNKSILFTRHEIAEFLHVALIFVDDEERYKPELDMISCDY